MPDSIDTDTPIIRDDGPISADIDGEVIMMSLERNNYYGLGETGSRIWALLETPQTPAQLCATLSGEYRVDTATCLSDIQPFLRHLLQERLIRLAT